MAADVRGRTEMRGGMRMSKLSDRAEHYRSEMQEALDYIWKHPETGYQEWQTHAYLADAFRKLGYELVEAGDIPGFYADLDTGRPGPCLLIMGELDALNCPNHPDNTNGKAHACGHCAQTTALLGVAGALKEEGALDGLSGKIRLMAVPAEELIEIAWRDEIRKEGKIHYFGGKPEFMRRGMMDGVDMAMMIHTTSNKPEHYGGISKGSNGMVAFTATFEGVASHAGGSPDKGVNALYAANQALSAINAIRETFRDNDHIRVHPIVDIGGNSVNIIPDKVVIESYVRGATMEAILDANRKIDRAMAGAAASIGAKLNISTRPGYYIRMNDTGMALAMKEAMEEILTTVHYDMDEWGTGCSDIGDLGAVMPTVHPHISGAVGHGHGDDYYITSFESACMDSAKVQLVFTELLLGNEAARAKEIVANYKPDFATMQDYFDFMDGLISDKEAVRYNEDGTVTLDFA